MAAVSLKLATLPPRGTANTRSGAEQQQFHQRRSAPGSRLAALQVSSRSWRREASELSASLGGANACALAAGAVVGGWLHSRHFLSARHPSRRWFHSASSGAQWQRHLAKSALQAARKKGGSTKGSPEPESSYIWEGLFAPVLASMAASLLVYPFLALAIAALLDSIALDVIKGDVSQFMQNFFSYNGLLFSFFASQTYTVLYNQQEAVYFALYAEVSEARSLMEQLTFISQGRPYYPVMLRCLQSYASELILGVRLGCPPAVLVSTKPEFDPLEKIFYLTSVGVPSAVYDTVRSLRQARGVRLAATQPKLPIEHFTLLYFLGALELLVFPLLGAGISGYEPAEAALPGHILSFQSVVFAFLVGAVVLTLQILQDMQRSPTTGLYDLKQTLDRVILGLGDELTERLDAAFVDRNNPDGFPDQEKMMEDYKPPSKVAVQAAAIMDRAQLEYPDEDVPAQPIPPLTSRKWKSLVPQREDNIANSLLITFGFALVSAAAFPFVVEVLKSVVSEPTLQAIREDNNAQWLQNFFTGVGFIFSLFVTQTFAFLFSQQEAIYYALYAEVSEAKALLEQLTLVSSNRSSYPDMLRGMQRYVREDLYRLEVAPSKLLAKRSSQDPLENILYFTSVGLPSYVYETVRGLRQARGNRLGALQRKLPDAHFLLLYVMGALELSVFPILAAGCAALDDTAAGLPGHIVFFHATLFGLTAGALALTFLTLQDLWDPLGGTYNVRSVLKQMVSGLEGELEVRLESSLRERQASSATESSAPPPFAATGR